MLELVLVAILVMLLAAYAEHRLDENTWASRSSPQTGRTVAPAALPVTIFGGGGRGSSEGVSA